MSELREQDAIVVIDDDNAMRMSCRKILSKDGFRVETFADGTQGLQGIADLKPSLIIVDLKMPGISGMEVIARVREMDPQIILVVITGYATIDTAVEAMRCGAYDFLPKPFTPNELRMIVNRGLDRRRLALETRRAEVEREILKRRFVTFVSHQLQTPLVAIHQYLDVLKHLEGKPQADLKRREWLDRCLTRTGELQTIIRDWLTLAKVEGASFCGQRIAINLNEAVPPILNIYEEVASAESITLEARLPEDACPVWSDRNCLNVVLDNLIVNAIKYNKPGGMVTVSAEPRNGEIVISVRDTGKGIPEKYRQLLFDEFFRIEPTGAEKTAGTGLGLAICRKIVSQMGGSITVDSQVDIGSTFRVCLPAYRGQPEEETKNGGQNGVKREDTDRGR